MRITIKILMAYARMKNYKVYENPYELNIFGIRSPETASNRFDDELHVFFRDSNLEWKHIAYRITTDPGTYFLKNPIQVEGTAILKEGQYVDAYHLGMHRGQYKALVEFEPVTVIRDYDRNAVLDFFNGKETTGYYGINIHRAKPHGETQIVDRWSAGCQVFENADRFDEFIKLCDKHRLYYGNRFTYTLIDLRAVKRQALRWFMYGTAAASILSISAAIYFLKD